MTMPEAAALLPAVGARLQPGVGRLDPERACLAAKILQARALHDLVLTLGTKPGSERSANDVSREAAIMDAEIEGELWSWVRSVMSQGADIRCDYDQGTHKTYEHYSARLDAAAIERADELLARLKTPNVAVTGQTRENRGTADEHEEAREPDCRGWSG